MKVEHHYGTLVELETPLEGLVGESFTTAEKAKAGYVLESVTPSATGIFTETDQTIIYQYKLIVPSVDPNESTDPGKPTETLNTENQNNTINQTVPEEIVGGANPIILENGANKDKFAELLHLESVKKQQLAKEKAEAKANLIRKNQLIAAQQAGENKDDLPQTNTNMWVVVGISLLGLGVLFIARRFKLNARKN
ncbi:MAG: MucBP domain-containing protein [Kurthia sp.]|nr:MucBP domain-containing protein [Candidatus Kurthia equi]